MNKSVVIALLVLLSFVQFSCSKKEPATPALQIPQEYDGASFVANAATQTAVLDRLAALTSEAQKGRTSGTVVTRAALDQLFTTGTPSLATVITPYFRSRLEGDGGWFDELAKASGGTYTPGPPTGQGGVLGGYLFDENGLELEQLVEKGQFGATLYNHAVSLFSGNITTATVDQLVAIYGAKPAFANSGSNNVTAANRDRAMANYAARRSDINDNNSLYVQMKNQFIKLQAAVKGGDQYTRERDEALAEIKLIWEKINAATIINYCHSAISTLSQTAPTDSQKGSALHAYGEAVGFLHGWRTINQNHKRITDAQIDQILVLLNAPQNGTPTSYKFVTDPVNELPKLTSVINQLKSIYGFTDAQIESFKVNFVNTQNR
ncbi:hypothetical protein [Eisenibacter elegans]|uniref:hypothetical protein n=1 Tax=Eisenibacter elegans TaxID=997 RepID=UPI0004147FF3|nr:hypothetical protein [Eisenibacter elegans]